MGTAAAVYRAQLNSLLQFSPKNCISVFVPPGVWHLCKETSFVSSNQSCLKLCKDYLVLKLTDVLLSCKNVLVSCVTCESSPALPWVEGELSCVRSPSSADAGNVVFSQESGLCGRRIWILVFSDALFYCSMKPQDNLVVCWSRFLSSVLLLFFFSFFFFFSIPLVSWGGTWCLVPLS